MWGELRKKNVRGLHDGLESMSAYLVVRIKGGGRGARNQNTKIKKKNQYSLFLLLVENIRYITLCFSTKFLLWFFVCLVWFGLCFTLCLRW